MSKSLFECTAVKLNALLNMAKIKLELVSDLDMYILFEEGMRRGLSYISNRYSKANNQYLKSYEININLITQ